MPDQHICGIYYVLDAARYNQKRYYLAQAELSSHTQISRLFHTTTLRQVFSNPSSESIKELRYTFPLYDGVSVGAYTITYGDTTLTGIVKQKAVAKQIYNAAVERGETASLLESLPAGVFGVTIGNLPPTTDVHVEISYSGELKHDAGVDGLRYMLPTSIAPRYGSYPGELRTLSNAQAKGIKITVDVDMGKSAIRKVQSPSHPIAVSMGTTSLGQDSNDFKSSRGSATLTQGTTELGDDFVLQIVIDNLDSPQAVLERHPSLESRAIMATLVPKFTLPQATPEIVFIADQSGSMDGAKNNELVAAMEVFLKSLPFGVRFNICAFGSRYTYLWPKSQPYNEANLKEALALIKGFQASYGGTEMLEPVKQAFLRKHEGLDLEIVLLTDGATWEETQLCDFINTKVHDEKVSARVFTLGIGSDVSHTLVEGVARAGNGFAQFITKNEQIDQKIIRSLKGCLYPHLKDYTLEVNFDQDSDKDDNEYEMVEKVSTVLQADEPPAYDSTQSERSTASTSFFDDTVMKDAPLENAGSGANRYAHLPALQLPKIIQAPAIVPPLFPFNRSTVYLLLGPDSPKQNVAAVTLRANGPVGPLQLKVPVYTAQTPASTLHQLAARKAIQDLEEGRGWIREATTTDGYTVKKKYSSKIDELAECEAVRLGETFKVAGKWTSFVAVDAGNSSAQTIAYPTAPAPSPMSRNTAGGRVSKARKSGGDGNGLGNIFGIASSFFGGSSTPRASPLLSIKPSGRSQTASPAMDKAQVSQMQPGSLQQAACTALGEDDDEEDEKDEEQTTTLAAPSSSLRTLISYQHYDGSWTWSSIMSKIIAVKISQQTVDDKLATILVLAYLEKHMNAQKDVWEMVAGKGRAWLASVMSPEEADRSIADARDNKVL